MISDSDRNIIQLLMGNDVFSSIEECEEFSYISNPDGSIRWLYPSSLKFPFFLSFYSTASFRSKVFYFVVQLLFFLGLKRWLRNGFLFLKLSKSSRLGEVLSRSVLEGYSIFTGTVGENRKAVIELHNSKNVTSFVKIALTKTAENLVLNEAENLLGMSTNVLINLNVPKLLASNGSDTIVVSNVKPIHGQQELFVSYLHINALLELYNSSCSKAQYSNLLALNESRLSVKDLICSTDIANGLDLFRVVQLAEQCQKLIDLIIRKDSQVTVCMAHCDFTPWNMYCTDTVLHVFDWELARSEMPIFFDLFHFVFQSRIMIQRDDYREIYSELNNLFKKDILLDAVSKFEVNINDNYIFYLIYNISYYLQRYIVQKKLHDQAFWLIDVWEDAITDALKKGGVIFE